AELGAVVGEHAILHGVELEGCHFTRLQADVDVVGRYGETVGRVQSALDVGDVPGHVVALADFHALGREVAADGRHVDRDVVAVALHTLFALHRRVGPNGLRVRVPADFGIDFPGANLVGLDD